MSPEVGTARLLSYEYRRVLRSPAVWLALLLILIAGTWGALNTADLHETQAADVRRMTDEEAEWYADVRLRAARYAQPSSTPVPYWQDPTGASGFSRYFLRRFAAKPHLPLSVLAVGQSDIQPFAIPLRLETLFGGDPVYDYEAPRALATGLFDLGFVLLFVLPLCVDAPAAALGAQERDQGILPFVAAQPVSPRRWWSVRMAALAAVFIPLVCACLVVALAVAGAPIVDAWPETLAAAMLTAAHTAFWLSVAGWCLARGHGAVATISVTIAVWLVLTVAVPLAGSAALRYTAPRPSPILEVNELRQTTDAVQREAAGVVARRLAARLGADAASIDPASLDYATRLVLITEEMEERLAHQEHRRQEVARSGATMAKVVSWLSPQTAFYDALTELAGTGTVRHQAFLRAVRAFQLELRAFMYPRVLASVRAAPAKACSGCPGRLTFTDYDAIPRFSMQDAPSGARIGSALRTAAWIAVLAVVVALWGIGGGRTWALGS